METKNEENEKPAFVLNDKEYLYENLSDKQKGIFHQLKDIEEQLMQIEFKYDQCTGTKNYFTEMLKNSLEKNDSEQGQDAPLNLDK